MKQDTLTAVGGSEQSATGVRKRARLPREASDTREARALNEDERRAREQSMVVVPGVNSDGEASGVYDVYGTPERGLGASHVRVYLGPLGNGGSASCGCRRHRHEQVRCEHIRRVAIAITETDLPAAGQSAAAYFRDGLPSRVRALREEHRERVQQAENDDDLPQRVRQVAALYRAAQDALESAPAVESEGPSESEPAAVEQFQPTGADDPAEVEPGVVDSALEARRVAQGREVGRFR